MTTYKYGDKLLKYYLKGVMKVQIKIIHLDWMIKSYLKALPKHKAKG